MARCMARAQTSGRADDNPETLVKRLRAFNEQSKPVVEMYKKFGKVHWIDAFGSIDDVYEKTRVAMMPKIYFILGPKCSGKTKLGNALCERTNMKLLDFKQFKKQIDSDSDEVLTLELIKQLRNDVNPRILIEDFP